MQYKQLIAPVIFLFTACAQIVTPDGGPKDVTPPHVVEYAPDSAATNFKGTRIVIRFDEYIALNDLNKQLIISPAVKRRPEITVRKKDIVIEFKDTLQPNTTYSISFGKAIRDITENNSLDNFRYVFSTGPVIDSLKCSGQVVNAHTLKPEKGMLVMLYRNTSDSTPYREKPYYYTRTDDNGNFLLTNLAPATYKIFALEDEGEDYLYNTPEERIAFTDSVVSLGDDVDSLRLLMFKDRPTKQYLVRTHQMAPGRFRLGYNLPVADPSVTFIPPLPASMDPYIEYNAAGDTINIWFAKVDVDSVSFVVKSGNTVLDTVPLKLLKPDGKKPVRAGAINYRALLISNNAPGKMLPGDQLILSSSNPIRSIDTSRIIFRKGADTLDPKLVLSANRRTLLFQHDFPEDSSFSVFIPPGTITDWYGQKNDTIKLGFIVQPARLFGNLAIKFPVLSAGNYIVQVVDEKDRVVKDTVITGVSSCRFSVMSAGNYRIRMIVDTNGDGKWTPGNYEGKRQPEKVFYYATTVRIRAGWDMDVEWRIE
ncbi:MAG TPA: Ig-like domain-containing domain [Bacteroidia bacterium]|nr:Ig-like domain-containing domain [Bacteroidia bacterium]